VRGVDAGCKEIFDGAFADCEPLRLHEVSRVGGYLVELVLKAGHDFFEDVVERTFLEATADPSTPLHYVQGRSG